MRPFALAAVAALALGACCHQAGVGPVDPPAPPSPPPAPAVVEPSPEPVAPAPPPRINPAPVEPAQARQTRTISDNLIGFLTRAEIVSNDDKICYYDIYGTPEQETVRPYELCPYLPDGYELEQQ